MPTELEALMTIAELAALSGESRSTIKRRIADGRIPVMRLSKRATRITRQAAMAYLAADSDSVAQITRVK